MRPLPKELRELVVHAIHDLLDIFEAHAQRVECLSFETRDFLIAAATEALGTCENIGDVHDGCALGMITPWTKVVMID